MRPLPRGRTGAPSAEPAAPFPGDKFPCTTPLFGFPLSPSAAASSGPPRPWRFSAAGSSVALPPAAHAEALAPQAATGPASFADVVERVKGAVVAIKVKAVETQGFAGLGEGEEGQELSPDDPFNDFLKRFGEGRGGGGASP